MTAQVARYAVNSLLPVDSLLSDHARVVIYLALHQIYPTSLDGVALLHHPYVQSLPAEEEMRTPLYFNDAERLYLEGTNLAGATRDRETLWRAEWTAAQADLTRGNRVDGELLTWYVSMPRSNLDRPDLQHAEGAVENDS